MENKYLKNSLEIANLIEDDQRRTEVLTEIATHLVEDLENWEKAFEICSQLPDSEERSALYRQIGCLLASKGQSKEGFELILSTEELHGRIGALLSLSNEISDYQERVNWILLVKDYLLNELKKSPSPVDDRVISSMTSSLERVGQYEEALSFSGLYDDPEEKDYYRKAITRLYADSGEIDKALSLASNIEVEPLRSESFGIIAKRIVSKIGREPPENGVYMIKDPSKLGAEMINSSMLVDLLEKHSQE